MSKRGRDRYAQRRAALDQKARERKAPAAEGSRFTDEERTAAEAAFAELLARQRGEVQ